MGEVSDREFRAGNELPAGRSDVDVAPVVCIGSSAGGVFALKELFRGLPPDTDMIFVVIHHLQCVPTLLPEILSKCTAMPVVLAGPNVRVEANHVYVLPSGKEMEIQDGSFSVTARSRLTGSANVFTVFLNSLLKSRHPGIAVVLSGFDSDGSAALKEFGQKGGITIVQAPCSAECPEMPRAAIATGCADFVLPPGAIAGQLEQLAEAFGTCCVRS